MRILYLFPDENSDFSHYIIGIIRLSNYLNSRKDEIKGDFKETYLDLRYENLPKYLCENLKQYRNECLKLLQKLYREFPFDVVGISCYSPYNYLNSVEVAYIIKKLINPKIVIVVGGVHPTTRPEDFQSEGIPEYFFDEYPIKTTPFDFLAREEGEIPFFNLIQAISSNQKSARKSLEEPCIILKTEILDNLDELPVVDFTLYENYSKEISKKGRVSLDFSRGCYFRCRFCQFSSEGISRKVRVRSIDNCIEDLRAIKNTPWMKLKILDICDPIFLPKKSLRHIFFRRLEEFVLNEGDLDFQMLVFDRIEICSKMDLENYKKFDMIVEIGLESFSRTLLYNVNKFLANTEENIDRSITNYFNKTIEIIEKSNSINLETQYYLLVGVPKSSITTYSETRNFLFSPRFNGKSLIEKYHIAFHTSLYTAFPGSKMYREGKVYYPEWWKHISDKQGYYGALVDCSDDFSFIDSIDCYMKLMKEIFQKQLQINNNHYNLSHLISIINYHRNMREFYFQKVGSYNKDIKGDLLNIRV